MSVNIPSNTSQPLVSILICNYNYGRFISAAIESALAQTYSNVEVIVVDDGSTDNSREVINGYKDRVRPIFQENGGQSAAFNAGFAASSGEIICLLDSDDYFLPNKVAGVVEGYAQNPSAQWLFHPVECIHYSRGGMGLGNQPSGPSKIVDHRRKASKFVAPPTTGLTFRRTTFARMTPLPKEVRIVSDNYMKFVVMALYLGFYLAEPLAVLRLHGNNAYSMGVSEDRRAQSAIQIASAMRSHFPELRNQADRFISITQAKCWRGIYRNPLVRQGVLAYLKNSTTASKGKIYAGALGRCCKHCLDGLRRGPSTNGATEGLHADLSP